VAGLVSSLLDFGSPAWKSAHRLAPGFAEVLAGVVRAQGPRSTVWIAESEDGTRLGFISLSVRDNVTGVGGGHVADLGVVPDARRMGVGSALMRAGEGWARERGFPVLSLAVAAAPERSPGSPPSSTACVACRPPSTEATPPPRPGTSRRLALGRPMCRAGPHAARPAASPPPAAS
jgi:GNAT superfamily N-acetyltransferase